MNRNIFLLSGDILTPISYFGIWGHVDPDTARQLLAEKYPQYVAGEEQPCDVHICNATVDDENRVTGFHELVTEFTQPLTVVTRVHMEWKNGRLVPAPLPQPDDAS